MSIDSNAGLRQIHFLACIALVEFVAGLRFPGQQQIRAGIGFIVKVGCCSCYLSFCVDGGIKACESLSTSVTACFSWLFETMTASVGPCFEH